MYIYVYIYIIGSACPYICTRTMRSLYTQSGAVPLSTPVREAADGGCTLLISRTISKWFTLSVCKIAAIQIRLARRADTEKRRAFDVFECCQLPLGPDFFVVTITWSISGHRIDNTEGPEQQRILPLYIHYPLIN